MGVPLGNNYTNVIPEQLCQSHLGTIAAVLLGNICASVTREQLYQSHLGANLPVLFAVNKKKWTEN